MDGLSNVAGVTEEFKAGGVTYHLGRMPIGTLAELESYWLELRDPFRRLPKDWQSFPPDTRKQLMDWAIAEMERLRAHPPSEEDIQLFMNSTEGAGIAFWVAVRRHHKDITRENALLIVANLEREEGADLDRKMAKLSGIQALATVAKNSDGQTQTEPVEMEDPHESRGQQSIAS